jgi:hypothetical protein
MTVDGHVASLPMKPGGRVLTSDAVGSVPGVSPSRPSSAAEFRVLSGDVRQPLS